MVTKLADVTNPKVDDLAQGWITENIRGHAWFPQFFGDTSQGQLNRIKRVLAINPRDFSSAGHLQIGGSLVNDTVVVGEVQRELLQTYFAYTFEVGALVLPDNAVTHQTVNREIVAFLRKRENQRLGGLVACLVAVDILGIGTHQMDTSQLYRVMSLVRSTHELALNPGTQEALDP